uniref:Oxysterol-binding protein n=1 Tax=Gasterosteus aculeatus aculeatus TaxID=481459 RepID=G3NKB9_GASAC
IFNCFVRSLYRSSLMSLLLTVSLCLPLSSCRYFVLDSEDGQLQYHLNELSKGQRPPRGSVPLLGAMVVSCDEYPYMFTIRSTSGDAYKLRAIDAQEQELWMTQLQLCTRRRSESSAKVFTHSHTHHPPPPGYISLSGFSLAPPGKNLQRRFVGPLDDKRVRTFERGFCVEPFTHGSRYNHRCWILSGTLAHLLSFLSFPSPSIKDLLIFKATSAATLSCLGECLSMLQHNVVQALNQNQNQNHAPSPSLSAGSQNTKTSPEALDPCDEVTDTDDNEEEDLGVLDDQRSIMLHLLSQLKLGMDLTRVVLPTFILEKRSLLEMYANFMAHPDMFLSITSGCTPEERIVRFVEYYLTAFHEGRKGAVAKKPYNPILGENFHCSWYVPRDRVRPLRTANFTAPNSAANADCYCVRFVAEQVSHHPPVSGFYCECKEKRMCVNTHVWTKSKFLGMSVGVSMVGEGVLYLLEHDEEYVFTLPCAYARSILTVPWVELGGKVTINCAKSGYSATVTFHTKPFYGGKVHRVTAEVKHNQTGNVVCKAQGEWNGVLEFTYSNGETKAIDTSKQPIIKKKILPPEKQGPYESRRLWQHVTASLKSGNMDAATEHKHRLEERQRKEGKQRAATKTPWKPKYFIKEGEGWVYHNPLWKTTGAERWRPSAGRQKSRGGRENRTSGTKDRGGGGTLFQSCPIGDMLAQR